ncbi:penicillin acylase family protein [Halomarina litorea]|uniref:penicillin acylase family protein n=1 Tax=Halomarina litorea TaxID=2961595 RepID=UPI0020C2E88A|nr:penicillin acylase family protein [Halomarina sp. BCD28]
MSRDPRQVLFALLSVAGLVAAGAFGGTYLTLAAPFSGGAWAAADDDPDSLGGGLRGMAGPTEVENPHGAATVSYDRWGVPHVEAENEAALYYAAGYVQARDRLFEMDLQRRLISGNLSAAVGSVAVESDTFHRKMDFTGAAEASWRAMAGTEYGGLVEAYTAGVNRYIDDGDLPTEFRLNDYRPQRWTPVATLLVGKQISWSLTGSFRDLQGATVDARLPEARSLYPDQLAHDSPVIREGWDPNATGASGTGNLAAPGALYDWLSTYQSEPGIGSNNWVVSGEHTASGRPIVANDPHLQLTVPPIWYEQRLTLLGEDGYDVRGVTFPGIPTVIIGQNRDVAWGLTNVGADVTDLYTYDRPSNDTYVYDGEVRELDRTTETIRVKGGEDVTVTVEKTVHGPLLSREGPNGTSEVAVAWTGLTATREARALYLFNRARTMDDVREGARFFDSPTQNLVAAARAEPRSAENASGRAPRASDGETYYRATGKYPYRYTDGEVVRGDRPFDGSAGEGEWRGFTPYGNSTWEGFVAYEDVPHVDDPPLLASANQRVVDDPGFYLSTSVGYADPFRGARIYEMLDERVESGDPIDRAYVEEMQADVRSRAATLFVPQILDARDAMVAETRRAARQFEDWDGRMTQDSEAALLFALFRDRFVNATFYDEYHPAGLDPGYYPHHYTLGTLPADSEWFDDTRTPERETRADIVARALREAIEEADREGYGTYGDYNRLRLTHPFGLAFLDYPERPMDGSPFTVNNFRADRSIQAGSSWRMIATFDGDSLGVIPGGQSGNPFSSHYHDQLGLWATADYKPLSFDDPGAVDIRFTTDGANGSASVAAGRGVGDA